MNIGQLDNAFHPLSIYILVLCNSFMFTAFGEKNLRPASTIGNMTCKILHVNPISLKHSYGNRRSSMEFYGRLSKVSLREASLETLRTSIKSCFFTLALWYILPPSLIVGFTFIGASRLSGLPSAQGSCNRVAPSKFIPMKVTVGHAVLFFVTILTLVRGRAFWSNSDDDKGLLNGINSLFSLKPASKVLGGTTSSIKVAAVGKVTVSVNGKEFREVSSTAPQTIVLPLKKNDVIAFEAEKTGQKAGLMAVVSWGTTKYYTGEDRFTARTDFSTWEEEEQKVWKSALTFVQKSTGAVRSFCHWDRADNMDIGGGIFDDKASYIWRLKSNPGGVNVPAGKVYMRLVVGGENCGAPVHAEDEITFRRVPDPKEDSLGGQNDDEPSEGFCACKLTDERGGRCYDMDDTSAESGRCRPRPCDPKFECVISGEKICIKRRGGTKLVMVAPNQCITVPAGDAEVLIPYEG